MSGIYYKPISRIFLNLSGGTVTGDTVFTENVSVFGNFSATTIFSGGTNLEDIIRALAFEASSAHTIVGAGSNILVTGTMANPIVSTTDSPIFNNLTVSGGASFQSFTSTTGYFGAISSSTISANTIFVNGVSLTGDTDNYTTAATLVGETVFFDRTDQSSAYTLDLSSLAPTGGTDYYVTGGTFDKGFSEITLSRNDGVNVIITGLTDFYTTAATLSNNTLFFDRVDQLSAYTVDLSILAPTGGTDNYTTAATLVGDVVYYDRTDQASAYTLSLSGFSSTDYFVTGATFDKSTSELTLSRNDGGSVIATGITDFYTTAATLVSETVFFDRIDQASAYTLSLSGFSTDDFYVTGGTFVKSTSTLTLDRNDGGSVIIGGITDNYTTAATLSNNFLYFDTVDQLSAYTVDLSALAPTGGTGNDFYTTASTLVGTTVYFDRNDQLSAYTLDLSTLAVSGTTDYYVTGTSVSDYNTLLSRNDAVDVTLSGTTTVYFSTEPDFNVYSGNTWVRTTDYSMFAYSVTLNKWVGTNNNRITGARAKNNQSNLFLRYEDGVPYNQVPYRGYDNYVITNVVASGRNAGDTWQARILTGTTVATDTIYTLDVVTTDNEADNSVNIEVLSGTPIYLYMSGSSIDYPRIDVYTRNR